MLLYKGKEFKDCNKEELLEILEDFNKSSQMMIQASNYVLKEENDRLKEENEKLWKAISK